VRLAQLFAEPARIDQLVKEIKELEHRADTLTHEVNVRIDSSFVTPLDREDIHLLASRLDNVVDLIDGTARRAVMFHIHDYREPAMRMADCIVKAGRAIGEIIGDMKKPKDVAEHAREIKLLEEEGDAIYFEAVGALFREDLPPLEVIKWKDMYEALENTLDECENVANALESISIKNA
jgi:predicted phosphate transport protein (TIGR00153 family)